MTVNQSSIPYEMSDVSRVNFHAEDEEVGEDTPKEKREN